MNYELLRELKDAGFPQEEGEYIANESPDGQPRPKGAVRIPTLSELIFACGEDFSSLQRIKKDGKDYYIATGSGFSLPDGYGKGETAESAVATLWLILNTPLVSKKEIV